MIKKTNTGEVTFIFDEETDEQVFLVGDFNNWDSCAHPLKKVGKKWQIKISLDSGTYAYKYLVNNCWINDHSADFYLTNPYGDTNSMVTVEKIKKPLAKKVATKKAVVKKEAVKKASTKKTVVKKVATKKTVIKKPTVKKTSVKKVATKKIVKKTAKKK